MNTQPGRILLIEDDPSQLLMLKRSVEPLGFQVKTRDTVKGGIFTIRNWEPDLVLMDLNFPDGTSMQILEMYKEDPRHRNTVFILISTNDSHQAITEALSNGALDFVTKPFHPVEMQLRVQNWMRIKLESDKSRKESELFGRFISKDVANGIMDGSLTSEIRGDQTEATILFFDLRGSTSIAETLEPDQFARFLTELFTDISDIIFGFQGSVNKFLGDGLLCTFGIPQRNNRNCEQSVKAALAIRQHFTNYNQNALPEFLNQPIQYGIGIASGTVFAGNFGSVHKIEYAVLGDPVNVAARLEALTKRANTDILIDGSTHDALAADYQFRKYQVRHLRGKEQDVRVYGIEGPLTAAGTDVIFFQ
ncbi:MAG: adenylate/guanylate cyclase domain-containing response regulator [Leptospiraceae bacterium]|nr:adenylate/guanylate cyclase domain-containing response regulator [Leptospiraceae bacterium]